MPGMLSTDPARFRGHAMFFADLYVQFGVYGGDEANPVKVPSPEVSVFDSLAVTVGLNLS